MRLVRERTALNLAETTVAEGPRTGELATAFAPNQSQLTAILEALK
jgi:hypothetical protein